MDLGSKVAADAVSVHTHNQTHTLTHTHKHTREHTYFSVSMGPACEGALARANTD